LDFAQRQAHNQRCSAALVGVFMFEIRPLLWLFALAIGAGLATQIWFIAGLKRTDRGV